jgi:hypothetical protein
MAKTLMSLLVLILLVGGAGAWNYDRNLKKENQVPRPWKSYETSDLRSMASAYEREIERTSESWEQARSRRATASGRGHVDDRAREFDRIYAQGKSVRDLKGKLADHEVVLAQIQEELTLRERDGDAMKVHLRRLLTYP